MSKRGKHLQIGAGSRSRSQAKAEDTARRSRKRASERAWKRENPGGDGPQGLKDLFRF